MRCDKCKKDFPGKEIELSHNIPKYMGGTDKNGRHYLCRKCHLKYEFEIIKLCFMNLVKHIPEDLKEVCRNSAKLVNKYFFKNG